MFKISTIEDARRLVIGATILGTGGGADPQRGLKLLDEIISSGLSINILSLNELPKDTIIASSYYVGSIAPKKERGKKIIRIKKPIETAFKEIENIIGKKIGALVATELGGSNTPVALNIAAKLGLPVIDGDLLGRAAPELHQCTVHIFNIPMYPSAIITETGNIIIVKEYANIDDYEAIARYLSLLGGYAAVVDTPIKLEDANKAVIKGTISLCLKLGKAVEEARKEGLNPVNVILDILDGWLIFKGIVKKYSWRDEKGFLKGESILAGIEKYSGHILRSWIMNEHIIAFLDDEPIVMPPDLIVFLDDDGNPVTNTELKVGMKINVIAAKSPEIWRSRNGLKFFGPKHFGFNYEYVPVENLIKKFKL